MARANVVSIVVVLLSLTLTGPAAGRQGGELADLARIQTDVKTKRISSYDRTGGNNDRFENINDGEVRELFNVKGAGMINHIWITIAPVPDQLSRNDIILRMYWDGNPFASVESPIGPFFGQGWNESYPFVSLPLAVGPTEGRAMVSYFVMPFSNGARIEIENQTGKRISAFYYYVDYVEVKSLPDGMGRFCAWYNHELTQAPPEGENEWSTLGSQGKNPQGEENYLIADIKGKGHFVGVNYYVHSPTPMWYGEGDDMIFIDAEPAPTLHGTGTEDYFNTSWCPKTLFTHPYFGYARVNDDVGWLGRTHVYRFHISDPIYFDKSLKFTIEHGHNDCLTLDLASVAYWYQAPPLTKLPAIADKEARAPKRFIQPADMHKWRNEWRKSRGGGAQLWGNEK
jgi:hypothetical protein